MHNKKLLGNAILLVTAVIWGTAFVFQRTGMDSIGPYSFACIRMALAAVFVAVLAFLLDVKDGKLSKGYKADAVYRSNTIKGGIFGGLALAFASTVQQIGLQYTEAGKAGFITALYMLLVPIFGSIFLGKRHNAGTWIAVAMGAVGMYMLCISGSFSLARGDIYMIFAAAGFAVQILVLDRYVGNADAVKIAAIEFAVTALLTLAPALLFENTSLQGVLDAKTALLYCGIISGGLGYTGQVVGQKFSEPTVAGMLMSLESVFALIAGALLLHERMSARELLGSAIMFAAIILVQIPARNNKQLVH